MPESNKDPDNNHLTFSKKVWIVGGIFSLIVIILLLFKAIFSVLLLALGAILIAVYFRGCASIIHRSLHWPKKLCTFLSVVVNLLLLIGFFWFVGAQLQQQISQLSDTLPKTVQHVKEQMDNSKLGSKVLDFLNKSGSSLKMEEIGKKFFSSSFGILSDLYILLLLSIFFTADPVLYKKGIVHLLPVKAKERGAKLLDALVIVLKKWLKGQIIGFFVIAVLTGIGLWITGMQLVLTLALIAGVLNFIPNFGPIIALIPGVLLALMQGPTTAIIVACIYTFVQIIQSAVTQPLIQQKMVSIPPALTILAQVAFGTLGGFWGVLMATPIVAILIKVVNSLYVEQQPHHKYEVN
ncbi:MAG TPA: AI-2E family transporter [Hanamia sp.]|nr:AI-2E family transporter [Hanamia sp.]